MDKRLEALQRDVKFLSLEVDKLMQKRQRQDGYLNDNDKERMEDLQRKIAARDSNEEEENKTKTWEVNHDLLYSLLCIAFFADQEIDESEKSVIFESYKMFFPSLTNEIFTKDFGIATNRFIDLKDENKRQRQFDESLSLIKDSEDFNNKNLSRLINCYIDIANADDFIHENEVLLIQKAIEIWNLNISVNKPVSGNKLQIED